MSAGKYSAPLRNSSIALPGLKRFIARTAMLTLATAARRELERSGERRVIGHPVPRRSVMNVRLAHGQAACVDAIEAKYRQHRGESARRPPGDFLEYLDDPELVGERAIRLASPVVEVAGNDQRLVAGHGLADALDQRADLPLPPALEETEVYVDAVELRQLLAEVDLAMEHAA